MPLISVIVPVYKVEAYLSRCVDSILDQTFFDFEIILVDDGSPDRCGEICDMYAEQDARVHVIHQQNGGLSAARNAAIDWAFAHSDSGWLSFVDSDDWVHPMYLEALLSTAQSCGVDIAICRYIKTGGEPLPHVGEWTSTFYRTDEVYMYKLANPIVAWGKIYRKECFSGLRFPLGMIYEDMAFNHILLGRYRHLVIIEQPLYAYYRNPESITKGNWTLSRLDILDARKRLTDFFEDKGWHQVARIHFERLLSDFDRNQTFVLESDTISPADRNVALRTIRRRLRGVLFRYRKKGWMELGDHERNARLLKNTFPAVRVAWDIRDSVEKAMGKRGVTRRLLKAFRRAGRIADKLKLLLRYGAHTMFRGAILLQSPLTGNLGNQASAVAELQMMRRLGVSCADLPWLEDTEKRCGQITPRRRLILSNGGSPGKRWRKGELRFRRILKGFERNCVIAFPRSLSFNLDTAKGRAVFERSRKIYSSHPNLTMFVRERYSYDFMKQHMPEVHVELVPDMTMLLEMELPKVDRSGALMCLRRDNVDSLNESDRQRLLELVREVYPQLLISDTVIKGGIEPDTREQVLRDRLLDFAGAKLVVTDRMHGMIFAAITETPCIVLNTLSREERACHEWLAHLDYIRFAENVEEVPGIMEALKHVTPHYDRAPIEQAMQPLYDAILNGAR